MIDVAEDLIEPPPEIGCDGTGWQVLGCLVRSGLDDDEVVKAFRARPDALDLIDPFLRWAITSIRRKQPRAAENAAKQAAIRNGSYCPPPTPPPLVPRRPIPEARIARQVMSVSPELADSWRRLADVSTDIPDGSGGWFSVPWLDVTVEQHRARADALRASIRGTVETIESHERAAADCERHGVATLRDLIRGGGRVAS